MSDEHTNDDENGQGNNLTKNPNAEVGSVIERLREMRASFSDDAHVDIEVPGYRGELVARYGPLPWEVVRNIAIRGERGKRNPDIGPLLAADGLANAIIGFYIREGDELKPLTWNGLPVDSYGESLRLVLGLTDAQTVRETVRSVFPDEFSLVSHYGTLMEWQAERDDADEGLIAAARVDDAVHPTSR